MAQIEKLWPIILKWEGGYQADPDDKGNYNSKGELIGTNMGVTPKAFEDFFHFPATVKEIKELPSYEAMSIMKVKYWDRWKADEIINQSVANILVDWLWMSGIVGIKTPQQILQIPADGAVGTKTIRMVNAVDQQMFHRDIVRARLEFYAGIIAGNPVFGKYKKGWLNRLADYTFEP